MQCQFCNKSPATVHLTQIVEDEMKKLDLCETCAKQKGVTDPTGFSLAELLLGADVGRVLDAALGDELVQSLHFLMGLRLQAGLAELDTGRQATGNVDPERLSSLERDLLKDALAVVKRFKALLHQRLRLDLL